MSVQHVLTNLSVGTHTISVQSYNPSNRTYDSSQTSIQIQTSVLSAPSPQWVQSASLPDAGQITWSAISFATRYDVYLDGTFLGSTQDTSYNLTNIRLGTHKATVYACFTPDETYNSSGSQVQFTTYKLPTPTLQSQDSTYVCYNDAAKTERRQITFVNADGSVSTYDPQCVVLTWSASASATQYRIYDFSDSKQALTQTQIQIIQSGTYSNFTNYIECPQGNHSYTVVAEYINSQNQYASEYNSSNSNAITKSVDTLQSPTIEWKETGKSPIYITRTASDQEDYYTVQLIAANGSITDHIYRSVKKATSGKTEYDLYVAANSGGLNITTSTGSTDTYTVNAIANSYDDFYHRNASVASNSLEYEIIQLNKPTGVSYNINQQTLTWTGDAHARAYRIDVYTGSSVNPQLSSSVTTDGNVTTYNLSVATGFWIIYVTALGANDYQLVPLYIDSVQSSPLVVGTLDTPVIQRNGQYLTWNQVNLANTYIVYNGDTDHKLTEIPATSQTAISYNMSSLPTSTDGIQYNIYVVATATIDSVNYLSANSNTVSFERHTLLAPTLVFDPTSSSQMKWESIPNAQDYLIYVNGQLVLDADQYTLNYSFSYSTPNDYLINATATNQDQFLFPPSASSNTLTYSVKKIATPVIAYHNATESISWTAMQYADKYQVYLNDALYATVSETNYTFSLPAGNYGVYVIAINQGQYSSTQYPNPKYLNSEKSNSVQFGTLIAPVLSIQDNIIVWNAIQNADYYDIYNYGTLMQTTPDTKFILNASAPAVYSIYVIAKSNSEYMHQSAVSNTIVYSITRLGSPTISLDGSQNLSWNQILNAQYYDVYVEGIRQIRTTNTTVNLTQYLPAGSRYQIYVIAGSSLSQYIDSLPSNSITKTIVSDSRYQVVIDNRSFPVDLPFTINQTLDETLDTATVTLAPNELKAPFEAYTEAEIVISDESGNVIIRQSPRRQFKYIIDSDDVEEVQIGTGSRYKHHLVLIEPTKKLETEILPNFTITQPLKIVINDYRSYSQTQIVPFTNGYVPYTTNQGTLRNISVMVAQISQWKGNLSPIDRLQGNIPTWSLVGTAISLPNDPNTSLYHEYVSTSFGSPWDNYYDGNKPHKAGAFGVEATYYGPVKRHWYIRANNQAAGESDHDYAARRYAETIVGNSLYTEIASTTENTPITYSAPTNTGVYDIIFTIDPVGLNLGYGNLPVSPQLTGMLSHDVPQPGYWANIFYGDVDVENWKYLRPYRVEYNGYTVKSTANELDKGTVSVVDAIQKALDVVNNEYYDSTGRLFSPNHNTVTNPKYTLADEIKMNPTYSNIYCPEMAFEKGKSLWDVMLELGRLFGGIPRLITGKSDGVIKKNVITFDILKDLTIANNMLSNQTILGTELENINSQITNHTTGYVSQISNMIPKDSIVVYPGSTCWISPRSKTDSDSYVTRTNMSLILDKPIYKIIDVQMTNFNSDNPSSTTSIINHVFEDTVYQSLNNDANGKGSALTWSKGDNKILGLGFLPQETESQAIWGMSSTDYVIQNILKKLGFANLLDANVYKYRIWYIPYTNARVTTEQQNISGLKVPTFMNLNQENNTISDDSFGKSAQTQVSRLGNNSIQKTMRVIQYGMVPELGFAKQFDGNKYYIDSLSIKFCNNYFDVTAEFSRNWNKINDRVGVNSEYRQYQIYGSDWVDRDISINNYCYLSLNDYGTKLTRATSKIVSDFSKALNGNPTQQAQMFYVTSLKNDANGNTVRQTFTRYSADNSGNITASTVEIPGLAVNASYNTFRNSIMYTGQMKDNFSAGVYAIGEYNQKYIQQDARYVDDEGKCPIMRITLCSPTITDSYNELKYDQYDFSRSYPLCRYYADSSGISNVIFSNKYHISKDNREAIRFVYQMHFLTYDRHISIHSGLTRYLYKSNTDFSYSYQDQSHGTIQVIAYRNYLNEADSLDASDQSDILYSPTISLDSQSNPTKITISGKTISQSGPAYAGFALVWSGTHEILANYDYDQPQMITSIPNIILNFSSDKISYKAQ